MKKIILVRHGYYNRGDGSLDKIGQLQIRAIGESIKSKLNEGESVQIMSSTARRAEQSAEILTEILGVNFERQPRLWTGSDKPRNITTSCEMVGDLIMDSKADILILVLHLEYSDWLPRFIQDHIISGGSKFPSKETEKGQAWLIDCKAKTCTLMTSRFC